MPERPGLFSPLDQSLRISYSAQIRRRSQVAKAADCKSAIPGSNPGGASFSRLLPPGANELWWYFFALLTQEILCARFQGHTGLGLTTSRSSAKAPSCVWFRQTLSRSGFVLPCSECVGRRKRSDVSSDNTCLETREVFFKAPVKVPEDSPAAEPMIHCGFAGAFDAQVDRFTRPLCGDDSTTYRYILPHLAKPR